MRILFAGCESKQYVEVLKGAGVKNYLSSFYSLGCGKKPPIINNDVEFFLLDSGGYSARVHNIEIDVKKYCEYLNKYKIKYAFNLDVNDLNESLQNFYYLNNNTNTYIMPVYHGPEWFNPKTRGLLDYYIDCFPFIALGGIAGKEISEENTIRFLNYVFSKTKDKTMVHGLGTTRENLLKKYPFFCVDSTSWLSVIRFANSKTYSKEMAKVRARKNHWSENVGADIKWWLDLEEKITRLWDKHGIRWGNLDFDKLMSERKILTYEEWKEQNDK